jgi:hypothetical protein
MAALVMGIVHDLAIADVDFETDCTLILIPRRSLVTSTLLYV